MFDVRCWTFDVGRSSRIPFLQCLNRGVGPVFSTDADRGLGRVPGKEFQTEYRSECGRCSSPESLEIRADVFYFFTE